MKQVTIENILNIIEELKGQGFKLSEIKKFPVYIGNDDELNGIHTAWYVNVLDSKDRADEDNAYMVDMINENYGNAKLNGKAILIS